MPKKYIILLFSLLLVNCENDPEKGQPSESYARTTPAVHSKLPQESEGTEAKSETIEVSPIPFLAQEGFLTIDGENISPTGFNQKMELLGAFSKVIDEKQLKRFVDQSIEDLVNETLFRKMAKNQTIPPNAVEEKFNEIKKSTSNFENHLKKLGQSEEELKKEIEDSLRTTAYVDSKIKIKEKDLRTLYKRNARSFKKAAQIRVSHIFLKVSHPKEKKATLKKAKEILLKVREPGADFGDIAKKMSQGPTRKKKGDLGWFSPKQLLPRFSKAAFKLKVGQVSNPVWTERGYHLIKVMDKKAAKTQSFESLKSELEKTLKAKRRSETIREIIKDAKSKGKVKIDASKIVKNPEFKYSIGVRKTLPKEIKIPSK